jgi:folylpolyglutamate synthase/dihydropteroate synthase
MRGKRVSAVLRAIAPLEPRPIFTAVTDRGARPPASLLAAWRRVAPEGDPGRTAADPEQGLSMATGQATGNQPIVVAGSLYLVGAVRGMLLGEETSA